MAGHRTVAVLTTCAVLPFPQCLHGGGRFVRIVVDGSERIEERNPL